MVPATAFLLYLKELRLFLCKVFDVAEISQSATTSAATPTAKGIKTSSRKVFKTLTSNLSSRYLGGRTSDSAIIPCPLTLFHGLFDNKEPRSLVFGFVGQLNKVQTEPPNQSNLT